MHQARPKCAERHHKDECRHEVHQRDGFDLRHPEARRHGQNAAAGGQVRKHGGGQHTGQQFAYSEHKEQDDHLGQRDSADGCPSVEAKIMAVKPSSTALDISSEGSPVMPSVRVLYQPAEAAAAEQGHRRDGECAPACGRTCWSIVPDAGCGRWRSPPGWPAPRPSCRMP